MTNSDRGSLRNAQQKAGDDITSRPGTALASRTSAARI